MQISNVVKGTDISQFELSSNMLSKFYENSYSKIHLLLKHNDVK